MIKYSAFGSYLIAVRKNYGGKKIFGALATLSFWASPNVALKLNPSKYSGEMNSGRCPIIISQNVKSATKKNDFVL